LRLTELITDDFARRLVVADTGMRFERYPDRVIQFLDANIRIAFAAEFL
jgi:hypothetical protein